MPIDCPRLQFPLRLVLTHMYHVIYITYEFVYMYYVSRIYHVLRVMALSHYVILYWVSPNDCNHLERPPVSEITSFMYDLLCITYVLCIPYMYYVLHMYYYLYVCIRYYTLIIIMLTCSLLHMCYNLVDRPTQLFYIWIFICVNTQI